MNGVQTLNISDDLDSEGYIAIQHHGEKGQVYRFRNLRIKELEIGMKIDREELARATEAGGWEKYKTFARLSGPGWLQSAITLGRFSGRSTLSLG